MPDRKGRKRRRERRDSTGAAQSSAGAPQDDSTNAAATASTRPSATAALPSRTARLSGLVLAVITFVLSAMIFFGAFDEETTASMVGRAILGLAMLLLALFVGALVAFPGQIRDYFARRRGG